MVENTEPAQLLEEERLRKEIAELRAKIERGTAYRYLLDLRYKTTQTAGAFRASCYVLSDGGPGSMDQLPRIWRSVFTLALICS